ncbi:hypothetical protein N177_3938 [Lutibaculum baratangense AMV1]|uniref:DUF2460 domain-containing protein n=1 Tax=Lutibaculum baratangense AMV1 TaxID=631454 RepID=V4R9C5_9HYPH|nr:hypothetical protein N177_3938 [Lutibaculum baratangense AMV1]
MVTLGSGHEERNMRWADSRRRYNAGYGLKGVDDLHAVIAFFEERRGRGHGFRFKDWADFKSCAPRGTPAATDQVLGEGDDGTTEFKLVKTYGAGLAPWVRTISKPVSGTVVVALDGVAQGSGWSVDETTGLVTFETAPDEGVAVSAGFEFDVPVRFDTDRIEVVLPHFEHGEIPSIPLVEIRP